MQNNQFKMKNGTDIEDENDDMYGMADRAGHRIARVSNTVYCRFRRSQSCSSSRKPYAVKSVCSGVIETKSLASA